MTPAEVNAEIGRWRGWVQMRDGSWKHDGGSPFERETCDDSKPQPYCSSWALAGPLLEEMAAAAFSTGLVACANGREWFAGEGAWSVAEAGELQCVNTASPTESIARAWLAWRASQGEQTL